MASKNDKRSDGIAGFESSTKQLEAIIEILENDNTTLEQSLTAFEQGIKLTRNTQKSLAEAVQKVQLLLEDDGQPVYKEFEEQE